MKLTGASRSPRNRTHAHLCLLNRKTLYGPCISPHNVCKVIYFRGLLPIWRNRRKCRDIFFAQILTARANLSSASHTVVNLCSKVICTPPSCNLKHTVLAYPVPSAPCTTFALCGLLPPFIGWRWCFMFPCHVCVHPGSSVRPSPVSRNPNQPFQKLHPLSPSFVAK